LHDVGSAEDIIGRNAVKIGKNEQMFDRNGLVSAFIAGINRLTGMKQAATPNITIQNTNMNTNINKNMNGYAGGRAKNKWVSFALCLCLGYIGAHKFYEGKAGMGLLYLFTFGLFGFGWAIDCIILLLKPNPYFV